MMTHPGTGSYTSEFRTTGKLSCSCTTRTFPGAEVDHGTLNYLWLKRASRDVYLKLATTVVVLSNVHLG
ncbi:hypothetical protein VNO77_05105 [Canavalia gladiata]|uniref:Uncharacterized protein n=1 Tax=Canavalia gladiata TaxID=3824 RepID=A0AAN9MXR0_CANGL